MRHLGVLALRLLAVHREPSDLTSPIRRHIQRKTPDCVLYCLQLTELHFNFIREVEKTFTFREMPRKAVQSNSSLGAQLIKSKQPKSKN